MSWFNSFDNLCKRIVCPTRHVLNQKDLIQRKFRCKVDYEHIIIKNKNNQLLSTIVFPRDFENLPTVIYLHGNGGHKLQCLQIALANFNLISFDFRACGRSQGQFITYGQQEVEDIQCVVNEIKARYNIKKVALWGRSMGASLALMYASLAPQDIFAMILDTPFRKLKKVVENVAQQTKGNVPSFVVNVAVYLIEKKVEKIVETNIFDSDFMMHLNLVSQIPIMFVYSSLDPVVKQQDVKELYDSYRGRKSLIRIDSKDMLIQGLHHQDRPKFFIQEGIEFVNQQFFNKSKNVNVNSKKGLSLSTRLPK